MERLTIKAPSGLIHLKDNTETTINTAIKKLSDLEDLEEQGKLLKLSCDTVWFICDKKTKYATVMPKSIRDLAIYEIEEIDKKGYYWSTRDKALAELKEL